MDQKYILLIPWAKLALRHGIPSASKWISFKVFAHILKNIIILLNKIILLLNYPYELFLFFLGNSSTLSNNYG
jgi:hypothetical protein